MPPLPLCPRNLSSKSHPNWLEKGVDLLAPIAYLLIKANEPYPTHAINTQTMKAALSALAAVGLFLPAVANAAQLGGTGTISHSCSIDDATNVPLTSSDNIKLTGSTTLNMSQNANTLWTLEHTNDNTPSGEVVNSTFDIQGLTGELSVESGDTDTLALAGAGTYNPTLNIRIDDAQNQVLKAGTYKAFATLTCTAN